MGLELPFQFFNPQPELVDLSERSQSILIPQLRRVAGGLLDGGRERAHLTLSLVTTTFPFGLTTGTRLIIVTLNTVYAARVASSRDLFPLWPCWRGR